MGCSLNKATVDLLCRQNQKKWTTKQLDDILANFNEIQYKK